MDKVYKICEKVLEKVYEELDEAQETQGITRS